ncbi:nuclease-related domain-containing DEAD/DEAH box helicase [Microbacterium sp. Bi128]|uniref:nuclease-related domain-containing DEAD/DEAH box helicase n=1 Tax=Microbacterium sp. Bi128 TaxID=2821115 RepID=UPI001E50A63A|nr:NERD domain-containing protein [Microbacterium sp. Bi128]
MAEKVLWDALKKSLPDDAVLAHSVQVRNGRAEHEIDILVLWPGVGMAAIEVKGGLVSVDNGQWYQSDKSGKRKILSPVVQSQGSLHAFKNWVGDQLGTPLTSRFAYMAALPYTPVPQDWEMAGCPRTLVLDQNDVVSPADLVRTAIEREGGGASRLAPAYMERIVRRLEGTLGSGSEGSRDPKELEDAQDHLTQRQSILLQATRSLPRIRFTGGAGSGKTWLAVEKARMLCKQGKRVGLFSYNKGLSQYLQDRVSGWHHLKPAFTGEFHDYARRLGVPDGKGSSYFEEELPQLLKDLAVDLQPNQRLDAVVVDEAQDFAPLWWEALLATTTDDAEIYAFLDDHQDVYRRWGSPSTDGSSPLEDLVTIHIDENLRNTRTVLPVRRVQCATEDALDVAGDCIDALIDEGWANNQIAMLTTKDRHPIHQGYFDRDATAEYWREFHANDGEFYGHVLGFKGLERSVVVLCVNGFKDLGRAAEQLYVGLSRARSLLVIVGDSDLLEQGGGRDLKTALSRAEAWVPAGVGVLRND